MNNWKIYMYIFPNGKKYIGKTKRTMNARKSGIFWQGYKKCRLLWSAIQKYGIENITEKILFEGKMTDEEASRLEKICILLFKTNATKFRNPSYGYNLTDGGDGVIGNIPDDKEKQRRIKQMKENGLKHKGVKLSEEHKKKLSAKKKGSLHPNWGKHLSEETKKKISLANSRENMSEITKQRRSNSKKKKVIAEHKDTKEQIIFNSLSEAANHFNVQPSSVTRWCKKQRKPSVPYIFDYLIANND